MAQVLKHPFAMQEMQVQSLGPEVPLEEEMATHSSTLACKIPWTEEPRRLQSMGSQRVTTEPLHFISKAIISGRKHPLPQAHEANLRAAPWPTREAVLL